MSVLVTGAGGFLGGSVVARLARDGRDVIAAGRTAPEAPTGVRAIALGDLARPGDRSDALAGVDTVVHCAARAHVLREESADPLAVFRAANRDATAALAHDAARVGVRRFVFVSSIGVNGGETRGTPFSAASTPRPPTAYAVAKWEAEQALADIAGKTGLEVVVIRPPLVLGPDPKGNLGALARAIRQGLPLPFGAVTRNSRDLVSIGVLADLIVTCIDHPAAPGAPLLVADGRAISTREVVLAVAARAGRRARLIPVPVPVLRAALGALGRRSLASQLLGDLQIDMSATIDRLGWRPRAQDREMVPS